MKALKKYNAEEILELESCVNTTAIEPMAHRWYLENANDNQPTHLLAPRFASVPDLCIPVPEHDKKTRCLCDRIL